MRRSLVLFLLAVAVGGVSVVYGVGCLTTPALAARPAPITHEVAAAAAQTPPAPGPLARSLPTPWQLLAGAEPEESPSAGASPAAPPPDDVELMNDAIAAGDLEVVKAMIAVGLPVNTDNGELRDPLDLAREKARGGDASAAKIVALLEAQGAIVRTVKEADVPEIEDQAVASGDSDENADVPDRPIKESRRLVFR